MVVYCDALGCKRRGRPFATASDLRQHQRSCLRQQELDRPCRQTNSHRPWDAHELRGYASQADDAVQARAGGGARDLHRLGAEQLDLGAEGELSGAENGAQAEYDAFVHNLPQPLHNHAADVAAAGAQQFGAPAGDDADDEHDAPLVPFEPIDFWVAGLHSLHKSDAERHLRSLAYHNLTSVSLAGCEPDKCWQPSPNMSAVMARIGHLVDSYGTSFEMVEVGLPSNFGNLRRVRFPLRQFPLTLEGLFAKGRRFTAADIHFEPQPRVNDRVVCHAQSDLFSSAHEVRTASPVS